MDPVILAAGVKSPRGKYEITPQTVPNQRTLGSIRKQARQYKEQCQKGKKPRPLDFFNSIEEPLFKDLGDEVQILDLIPPPELHLMLGVTSKIYEEVLLRLERDGEDRQRVEHWAAARNIVREEYRGGALEGNKCRALLKSACDLGRQLPTKYKVFAVALAHFNKVVTACFGKELQQEDETQKGWEDVIRGFHEVYLACNISITPKVHAVLVHVPQWCAKFKRGLGYASEQASEAVHHDFKTRWGHYKVNSQNPNYGDHLLRCVVSYNGLHV